MPYGFLRVAAAMPDVRVADCPYNKERILALMHEAQSQHVQIMVFPELSLTAYTCGDLFFQTHLRNSCEQQLAELLHQTAHLNVVAIIGMPIALHDSLYNCAVVCQRGNILGVVPKTYIPNYAEFYEKRWFTPGMHVANTRITLANQTVPLGRHLLFNYGEACFGIELCEDLWVPVPPSSHHAQYGAHIIFNLSASNELIGKHAYRTALIQSQSARCLAAYVYASAGAGESTSDLVYAGFGLIAENGEQLAMSERFAKDKLIIADIDVQKCQADRLKTTTFEENKCILDYQYIPCQHVSTNVEKLYRQVNALPFVPQNQDQLKARCDEIFSIQVQGLVKRLAHTHAQTAIIGISGGLDSTLALLVTAYAFDILHIARKNIIGVTMPGFGTTDRTYQNALTLMRSLDITIKEIDITSACMQHFSDIGHDINNHNVVFENAQARERTQILMDIANMQNGLVIGTGDLSELALGWATYNGDHMSMYAVNVGVPKTLVKFLIQFVADQMTTETSKHTLYDILDTPISPELLPADSDGQIAQKTEELVGPYELHDFFLYYMVRFGFTPTKIFFLANHTFWRRYEKQVIKKWLTVFYKRFFAQQFKRNCLPDGPKVGTINLSPRGDWRMPSDCSVESWLTELDAISTT